MRGIKNKESGKWKKWSAFLILLLMFLVLLNSVKGVYQKKKAAEEALVRMETEKTKLEERDQFLKASIARMATQEGIEFEMRKKLNVAQVGESVAVIVDEKPTATTSTPTISPWQKFLNFWTNLFK